MHEAVIVSTARTPIGTAFEGSLVDDVALGETLDGGGDIGRDATIEAGLAARCAGGGMSTALVLEVEPPR